MRPYSTVHQCRRESSAISEGVAEILLALFDNSLVASSTSAGSGFGNSFRIERCRIAS